MVWRCDHPRLHNTAQNAQQGTISGTPPELAFISTWPSTPRSRPRANAGTKNLLVSGCLLCILDKWPPSDPEAVLGPVEGAVARRDGQPGGTPSDGNSTEYLSFLTAKFMEHEDLGHPGRRGS